LFQLAFQRKNNSAHHKCRRFFFFLNYYSLSAVLKSSRLFFVFPYSFSKSKFFHWRESKTCGSIKNSFSKMSSSSPFELGYIAAGLCFHALRRLGPHARPFQDRSTGYKFRLFD
jgi:hypothetical protein